MKAALISALLAGLGIFVGLPLAFGSRLVEVYSSRMQFPFFAAFLTLAAFILSLKTNILLRLYKDLFENERYMDRVRRAAAVNGKEFNRFAPLVNLGRFLIWTVFSCFATAVLQVSVGFIRSEWAIGICLGSATVSLVFAFWAWWAIRGNLDIWFELLESEGRVSPPGA